MATTVTKRSSAGASSGSPERGFSLVEVMISIVILTIGLLSLLGVFGLSMAATQTSQQDMIAKQLANECLESIMTARDTSQLTWASIQNVADGGIFLNGYQNMSPAGPDGILGTADDDYAHYIQLREPGPDGVYGTTDDQFIDLKSYQRQIQILPVGLPGGGVDPTLRSVTISISYYTPQTKAPKSYVLTSLISQYR